MFSRSQVAIAAIVSMAVLVMAGSACKRKRKHDDDVVTPRKPPTELEGMAAIPGGVTAVLGIDVASLRQSFLVKRAVEQMFTRDPGLEERIDRLLELCQVDATTGVEHVIIGLGGDIEPGSRQQAIMVVTGTLASANLASCVGKSVVADKRTLVADMIDSRTLYGVKRTRAGGEMPAMTGVPGSDDGSVAEAAPPEPGEPDMSSDEVWFSVSAPDTVVVATSKPWLIRALADDDNDKIMREPAMAALLGRVDASRGMWAAGKMAPSIGAGLVESTDDAVSAPPVAMFGDIGLEQGVHLQLGVEMADERDASALQTLIAGQMGLWALAAQQYGLGPLLDKLRVTTRGHIVYVRVDLSDDQLRQVLARIDTSAGSLQNPAEAQGEP